MSELKKENISRKYLTCMMIMPTTGLTEGIFLKDFRDMQWVV